MKTGTTALQSTASRRRDLLLAHGVLYPGTRYNHRREAQALFRRQPGVERKRPDSWDSLAAQVAAEQLRRVLISNEMIAAAEETVIREILRDLGPLTHVTFTVRSFAAVLPSLWQQYVKSGYREDFTDFLALRLGNGPHSPSDMARHDQASTIERWVDVVGAENVTVIVVDKREPRRVPSAFEELLDLPTGMLHEPELRGESLNRSLSVHEASLLLELNRLIADKGLSRDDTDKLVFRGVIARMLDHGPQPHSDHQLALPEWAIEPALRRSRAYADAIGSTGVRVIGSLDELTRVPRVADSLHPSTDVIPVEVAVQAVLGAISAGLGRGSNFDPQRADDPPVDPPSSTPKPPPSAEIRPSPERRLHSLLRRAIRRQAGPRCRRRPELFG